MGDIISCEETKSRPENQEYELLSRKTKQLIGIPNLSAVDGKKVVSLMKSIIKPTLKEKKEAELAYYYADLRNYLKKYDSQNFRLFLKRITDGALLDRVEKAHPQDQKKKIQTEMKLDASQDLDVSQCTNLDNIEDDIIAKIALEVMKKTNLFYELTTLFAETFSKKYIQFQRDHMLGSVIDTETKVPDDINNTYKVAKEEIKCFRTFLNECLVGITKEGLARFGQELTVTKEKRFDKITSKLIFSKKNLYDIYFFICRLITETEELKIKNSIVKLKRCRPESFNVEEKYCLRKTDAPYQLVIDSLNYLDSYYNPYDKFELVYRMRKEIITCIDKYLKEVGEHTNVVSLTADQLVPVYCFCIASCGNSKMRAHQLMMSDFVDAFMLKFGEEAYYFTTFTASIDFLISICNPPPKKIMDIYDC